MFCGCCISVTLSECYDDGIIFDLGLLNEYKQIMFTHYLKISFRSLWKHRLQTIICLVGLSVGMACFALSAVWLQYIESFEDFVKDCDRLYLLSPGQNGFEPNSKEYESQKGIAESMKEMCPEIESVITIRSSSIDIVKEGDQDMYFSSIIVEDPSIVEEMLNLNLKYGRLPKDNVNELAINTTAANMLFETDDVVGQTITIRVYNGTQNMTIVGVFEPLPDNTKLFSYVSAIYLSRNEMRELGARNLIKVYKGTDVEALQNKIRHIDVSYTAKYYQGTSEEVHPDMSTYSLLPLTRLRSDYPSAFSGINGRNVRIIVAISLITIISVLCHYFITMITLIRIRCRALALRRMLGSSVMGIVGMNVMETMILFIGASILGAIVIYFIIPYFIMYSQLYNIRLEYLIISTVKFWSLVFLAGIALTVVATLLTIRHTQHTILHGHQSYRSSSKLDYVANMIQQTVSLCILFCIGTIVMQISFLKNSADLGFDHRNRMSIFRCPDDLKEYVLSLPEVVDSYVLAEPLFPRLSYSPYRAYASTESSETFDVIGLSLVQEDVNFWGMTMLEGSLPENEFEVVVNETLAKRLGDTIVGRTIRLAAIGNEPISYTIVGRVKDTYDASLLTQPKPTVYQKPFNEVRELEPFLSLSIKVKEETDMSALCIKIWDYADSLVNANNSLVMPSSLSNMETQFESIMRNENLLYKVLMLIAACTLFTTLFGVFSVLSLSLEQRKKEIALRKIHGATVAQVMSIFIRSNIVALLVSSAIAFPIAYILMQEWLSVYVRQISFPWYLGLLIFAAMAILIFATIFWKIRRAVKENPVEVIKNE